MKTTCGALILAGGRGRRMGGKNKALLNLEEKTFFERLRTALDGFEEKIISVNDTEWITDDLWIQVRDERQDCGPMEGLRRALTCCESDALFVTACDMPFVTAEFARTLTVAVGKHDALICCDRAGDLHPLCGVYTKACLPVIEELMEQNDYRIRQIAARTDCVTFYMDGTDFSDRILTNVNTLEELERLTNAELTDAAEMV